MSKFGARNLTWVVKKLLEMKQDKSDGLTHSLRKLLCELPQKKYVMLTFVKDVIWALWVTVVGVDRGNNFQNIMCSSNKIVLHVLKNPSGYGNTVTNHRVWEEMHTHSLFL